MSHPSSSSHTAIGYSPLPQTADTTDMASPKFSDPAVDPFPEEDQRGDFRAIDPESGVKRGLKTRHLSMMALAGIIGPGLLVGAGNALASGGPASLLIGFGVIGIIAFRCVHPTEATLDRLYR